LKEAGKIMTLEYKFSTTAEVVKHLLTGKTYKVLDWTIFGDGFICSNTKLRMAEMKVAALGWTKCTEDGQCYWRSAAVNH
jgi:hypothetical protein